MQKKKLVFILPGAPSIPSGGHKIIYEYALRLPSSDLKIEIIHLYNYLIDENNHTIDLLSILRYGKYLIYAYFNKPWKWFIHKSYKVKFSIVRNPHSLSRIAADIIIVTSWHTAYWAHSYNLESTKVTYFIQGDERIFNPHQSILVEGTWSYPYKKIVVSNFLRSLLLKYNQTSTYIPNAIDHSVFFIEFPIVQRNQFIISMPYNSLEFKGSSDGIFALTHLKPEYPDIQVLLFGIAGRPENIPNWMQYFQNPDKSKLRNILNTSSIFIAPSKSEGFGLPVLEAAACGNALCGADNGGHSEIIKINSTGLLYPPGDRNSLLQNMRFLLSNPSERERFARSAQQYSKSFNWEVSVSSLTSFISKLQTNNKTKT